MPFQVRDSNPREGIPFPRLTRQLIRRQLLLRCLTFTVLHTTIRSFTYNSRLPFAHELVLLCHQTPFENSCPNRRSLLDANNQQLSNFPSPLQIDPKWCRSNARLVCRSCMNSSRYTDELVKGCGDVQTKKKLDSHRNQCHSAFTCIDCMTTFHGVDYRGHTVC